jgi:hypothetical protein
MSSAVARKTLALGFPAFCAGSQVLHVVGAVGCLGGDRSGCHGVPDRERPHAALRLTQRTADNGVVTPRSFDALTDRLTAILAGGCNVVENLLLYL